MIYLVSNQKNNFEGITNTSVEDSLEILSEMKYISVDSETTGLSAINDRMFMLQLGNKQHQIIIDSTIDFKLYKPLLENSFLILQNAKFDLQFLYKYGIYPDKLWDTYLAEIILTMGLQKSGFGLDKLVAKYCNVIMSKSIRETISRGIIGYDEIIYGAKDIEYLEDIMNSQIELATEKDVLKVIKLENAFVRALAYIEFCGIYIDVNQWKEKTEKTRKRVSDLMLQLDAYIINHPQLQQFIDPQLNLFSDVRTSIIGKWNSTKQMIPIFKALGIDVRVDEKESIAAEVIGKHDHPFVKLYLEYKKEQHDLDTYGQSYIDHVNPITGRIHPSFNQIINTGRISCRTPNVQNPPNNEETRSCFKAQKEGYILVNADYSKQEDILFVNYSQEKKLIDFYNDPNSPDGHSWVAKLCFPELRDIEVKDVKHQYPELRQRAKSAKFAIHYGGNGKTISDNLSIPLEEGEKIYYNYLKSFPGINAYFKQCRRLAEQRGYILISPITGRKFWAKEITSSFLKDSLNYPILYGWYISDNILE